MIKSERVHAESALPDEPVTIAATLRKVRIVLSGCTFVDNPGFEARQLVGAALHVTQSQLVAEDKRALCVAEQNAIDALLARRIAREPLTRILGRRAFADLDLLVTPDVLDPRADTEVVLHAVAARIARDGRQPPRRILDLATGSGALILALLQRYPAATGVATDLSSAALGVAARNAARHELQDRVQLYAGDWFAALPSNGTRFDLIVSNPPYIRTAEIAGLAPEVANHDPLMALDGGPDGLDAYRAIARGVREHISREGVLVLEVGLDQADPIASLFASNGFETVARGDPAHRDLGGIERVVMLHPETN